MFQPAGQPVWPVSTDSPNVLLHPQRFSGYWPTSMDQCPVTSPAPTCNVRKHILKKRRYLAWRLLYISYLSAKPLISHSSSSSSGTHVSTAVGPLSLAGSCFLGRNALDRKPFLCGVGVSTPPDRLYLLSSQIAGLGFFFTFEKYCHFTFRRVSVFERTRNLPDTVFRADAIGTHFPSFYNLCCYDICVGGLWGN